MKIQINTQLKTISIEGITTLGDLIKYLKILLPKNSPIGYWKDYQFTLIDKRIDNWNYPVVIEPIYIPSNIPQMPHPQLPWWQPPYYCGTDIKTNTPIIKQAMNSNKMSFYEKTANIFDIIKSTENPNIINFEINE